MCKTLESERFLSPRVRGRTAQDFRFQLQAVPLPARAGENHQRSGQSTYRSTSPRACGGEPQVSLLLLTQASLSPRVRGRTSTPDNSVYH